jgi:hypothetical protein
VFSGNEWCGLLRNRAGPWRQCLGVNEFFLNLTLYILIFNLNISFLNKRLPKSELDGAFDGCLFDLCVNENKDENDLDVLKCAAYTKFNDLCLSFAARNGLRDWRFNWRESANCRKKSIFKLDKKENIKYLPNI